MGAERDGDGEDFSYWADPQRRLGARTRLGDLAFPVELVTRQVVDGPTVCWPMSLLGVITLINNLTAAVAHSMMNEPGTPIDTRGA